MSVYLTVDVIPTVVRVYTRVCACVHAFLAFCLGIALEQFTACHSFSMTGSKSERRRRMGGKREGKGDRARGRKRRD